MSATKPTIEELLAVVREKTAKVEQLAAEEQRARSATTNARNELNRAQKAVDDAFSEMRKAAPGAEKYRPRVITALFRGGLPPVYVARLRLPSGSSVCLARSFPVRRSDVGRSGLSGVNDDSSIVAKLSARQRRPPRMNLRIGSI